MQRILVRQGVSRDLVLLLLDDFRDAVAHFDKHPVTVPLELAEARAASATSEFRGHTPAPVTSHASPRARRTSTTSRAPMKTEQKATQIATRPAEYAASSSATGA